MERKKPLANVALNVYVQYYVKLLPYYGDYNSGLSFEGPNQVLQGDITDLAFGIDL